MKQIIKASLYAFATLSLVLISLFVNAQDALKDTLSESAYNFDVPKHVVNVYSNFVPYVLFSLLGIGMLYISYRYWADNRPEHPDFSEHHLEH